jgi:PPM family protein phosphatase
LPLHMRVRYSTPIITFNIKASSMMHNTNRRDIRDLRPRLNPIREASSPKSMTPPSVVTKRPKFELRGYGATHVGCKRKANEDSFWMLPKQSLWIVADGMGGHAGGQIASTLTVQEMGKHATRLLAEAERAGEPVDVHAVLTRAVAMANEEVHHITDLYPSLQSMGSTLTSMLAYGDTAYFAHIGDSRAYLIREGRLIQVTEDHSFVQELVNFGHITPEQAITHYRRNLILKSISRNSNQMNITPDIYAVPMREGDRFLLCSDGLIEHVRDEEILRVSQLTSSAMMPQALISRANSADYASPSGIGTDNTTVVIVEVGPKRHRRV